MLKLAPYAAFTLAFLTLSALSHWGLWGWMLRAFPAWTRRHRGAVRGSLVVLFALMPLGRSLAQVEPHRGAWATVAAIGTLWHLTTYMAVLPIVVARAIGRLPARLRGRAGAVAPPASPELAERRVVLERVGGAAVLAASAGTLGWGAIRGRFEWTIEEVPIRLARLPKALDGFTIVQISDLHVGTFIRERELAMGLGLVRSIKADLIAVTGDILDFDPRYVPLAARMIGELPAREGVVCIPGNHDYYTGVDAVLSGMQSAGVEVLLNRGKVVAGKDGGLAILGVDDLWAASAKGGQGPDLSRAQSMVPRDLATVLLAHQPRYAPRAAGRGVDLQLSGHTHGGQINPGFAPGRLFLRYIAGRYDLDGGMQLYVNRGFGTAGPPSRVGAPPEITKLVLVAG